MAPSRLDLSNVETRSGTVTRSALVPYRVARGPAAATYADRSMARPPANVTYDLRAAADRMRVHARDTGTMLTASSIGRVDAETTWRAPSVEPSATT